MNRGYEMFRTTGTNTRNAMESSILMRVGLVASRWESAIGTTVLLLSYRVLCEIAISLFLNLNFPCSHISKYNGSAAFFSPLKVKLSCIWDCDFKDEEGVLCERGHRASGSSKPRMPGSTQPSSWGGKGGGQLMDYARCLVRSIWSSPGVLGLYVLREEAKAQRSETICPRSDI